MGTGSVALMTGLAIAFGLLAYSVISATLYKKKLQSKITTRGMSGSSGQTVDLVCPAGQNISFENPNSTTSRGVLYSPAGAGTTCDPFYSSSGKFFNPSATVDLFASGITSPLLQCEGLNSCSYTVPTPSQISTSLPGGSCLVASQEIYFVGTYDCIPNNP